MISRHKCNCFRNREVYDIYEYIICLLILKPWNWCVFREVVFSKVDFVGFIFFLNIKKKLFFKSNYYLALQITLDSQVVNVFIHRGRSYKGLTYLIYSLQLTISSPTKSCPTIKTVIFYSHLFKNTTLPFVKKKGYRGCWYWW